MALEPKRRPAGPIAVMVLGLILVSCSASGGTTSDPAERVAGPSPEERTLPAPTAKGGPGPSRTVQGVGLAGFARTAEGARAAGVSFTSGLGQASLFWSERQLRAALAEIGAKDADLEVGELVAELRELGEFLDAGRGPTWWSMTPVAMRVHSSGLNRARVSTWNVRVLFRVGVAIPQASWSLDTAELVWERGDWRLYGLSEQRGPSVPLDASDAPAMAEQFSDDLAGFEPLEPAQ